MNKTAKKIKEIIKGSPKESFGTNPNDPWSAKYGIAESSLLDKFLNSRGINPKFVTKDTKISHAKSSEFLKWKNDHQFTEDIELDETKKRPFGKEAFRQASYEREKKHNEFMKSIENKPHAEKMQAMMDKIRANLNKEEVEQLDEISKSEVEHHFDKWTSSEHAPDHHDAGDDIKIHKSALNYLKHTKEPKEKHEKIAMHIANKFHGSGIWEEVDLEEAHKVGDMVTVNSKFFGKQKGKVTKVDDQSIHVQRNGKKYSEKYPHDAVMKEETKSIDEISKDKVERYLSKIGDDQLKKHGMKPNMYQRLEPKRQKGVDRALDRLSVKEEEIEQIDELSKDTLKSYQVKRKDSDWPKNKKSKKFQKMKFGIMGANSRLMGHKPTSEDIYQDGQAPTQTSFDGANAPDNTEPSTSKIKTGMSKSARMIKSLYKHHNMKEELYDTEKEDKSVATYGKKPKMIQTKPEDNLGDNIPQAAAVLKGGKTLTGQTRDTLEIDPEMKRPTRPDAKPVGKQEKNKINN